MSILTRLKDLASEETNKLPIVHKTFCIIRPWMSAGLTFNWLLSTASLRGIQPASLGTSWHCIWWWSAAWLDSTDMRKPFLVALLIDSGFTPVFLLLPHSSPSYWASALHIPLQKGQTLFFFFFFFFSCLLFTKWHLVVLFILPSKYLMTLAPSFHLHSQSAQKNRTKIPCGYYCQLFYFRHPPFLLKQMQQSPSWLPFCFLAPFYGRHRFVQK